MGVTNPDMNITDCSYLWGDAEERERHTFILAENMSYIQNKKVKAHNFLGSILRGAAEAEGQQNW